LTYQQDFKYQMIPNQVNHLMLLPLLQWEKMVKHSFWHWMVYQLKAGKKRLLNVEPARRQHQVVLQLLLERNRVEVNRAPSFRQWVPYD
jgi:hypothetical protein